MLQQFRRAIAVTAANGHSQHILQRLHYVRGTEQEARDACRSHHSDNRWRPYHLAPYVGCRRVVLLPKQRHSVSCRRHVANMFQSCRRHDQMSCRPGCPKRHDMSAVPDMSVKCRMKFSSNILNSYYTLVKY